MLETAINEKKINDRFYPKLMKSRDHGFVVLMTGEHEKYTGGSKLRIGTVVTKSGFWPIGTWCDAWSYDSFDEFSGSITITDI